MCGICAFMIILHSVCVQCHYIVVYSQIGVTDCHNCLHPRHYVYVMKWLQCVIIVQATNTFYDLNLMLVLSRS